MLTLKFTSNLSKFFPAGIILEKSGWSSRGFVTASSTLLQDMRRPAHISHIHKNDFTGLSKKDDAETCQNVKEAAEAVKEGAREVRKTTEFIRDVATSTAESVNKMSKEVTDKVSDATDAIKDKARDSVSEIKDKILGK